MKNKEEPSHGSTRAEPLVAHAFARGRGDHRFTVPTGTYRGGVVRETTPWVACQNSGGQRHAMIPTSRPPQPAELRLPTSSLCRTAWCGPACQVVWGAGGESRPPTRLGLPTLRHGEHSPPAQQTYWQEQHCRQHRNRAAGAICGPDGGTRTHCRDQDRRTERCRYDFLHDPAIWTDGKPSRQKTAPCDNGDNDDNESNSWRLAPSRRVIGYHPTFWLATDRNDTGACERTEEADRPKDQSPPVELRHHAAQLERHEHGIPDNQADNTPATNESASFLTAVHRAVPLGRRDRPIHGPTRQSPLTSREHGSGSGSGIHGLTCVSTVPYKRPGRWIKSQGRWLHPAQVEGASNLPPPSATCSRELSSLSAG